MLIPDVHIFSHSTQTEINPSIISVVNLGKLCSVSAVLGKRWLCCDIASLVRSGSGGRGLICLFSGCGFAYATQSWPSFLVWILLYALDGLLVCVCLQALFRFSIDLYPKSLSPYSFWRGSFSSGIVGFRPTKSKSSIFLPAWCLLLCPLK